MPKLCIFDWDGTLMDSERQIVLCMQAAANELGLVVPSHADVRHIIGLGLPEAIFQLFPQEPGHIREQIRRAYAQHFLSGAGGASELFPGARELLHELRRDGWLLAVATGKSRLGLDRVLGQTGLADLFHATRCADETASKPDPLMLHELLACMEVKPEDSLMIGDTSYDLEMACRANMRSIGIAHGAHARDVLERHQPLTIVPDLTSLSLCLAAL
jgi:phosphoglycolate phosphatase